MELTDTQLIDWLEKITKDGACPGLINDDVGHWAVSFEGTQNATSGCEPQTIWTSFIVEANQWHNSIREAIKAAIEQYDK